MKITNYIGVERYNKQGLTVRVTRYNGRRHVKVLIVETGEELWTTRDAFLKGTVMSKDITGILKTKILIAVGTSILIAIAFIALIYSLAKSG